MSTVDEVLAGYDGLQAGQAAFYKDLHQHPELSHPATTDRVAAAFGGQFGDNALRIEPQTVSEDFPNIPNALGIPYTYWSIGFTDRQVTRAAEQEGKLEDLPTNHSPKFLPPTQPCLRTGTEALVTAALAWLAKH
jgi:metal-dependent amidase/aminoacylase/carboxypeptidase family protein